jgi:hypothetical protein
MSIYKGDIGVEIRVAVVDSDGDAVDLTLALTKNIIISKPDGSQVTKSASFVNTGSDGLIRYYTTANDLDLVGLYEYQGYIELSGVFTGHTEASSFEVLAPSPDLTEDDTDPIDATWGGASANSYISLGDANAFISKSIVNNSAWTGATMQQRVAALLEAVRDVDSFNYIGYRYYYTQNLEWPRTTLVPWPHDLSSFDQTGLGSEEQVKMKRAVREANCYQALWILQTRTTIDHHSANIAAGVSHVEHTTGPLTDVFKYKDGVSQTANISPWTRKILRRWIAGRKIVRG